MTLSIDEMCTTQYRNIMAFFFNRLKTIMIFHSKCVLVINKDNETVFTDEIYSTI